MRWRKIVISAIGLLIVLEATQLFGEQTIFTSSVAHLMFSENLHEVAAGRYYRAGEMDNKALQQIMTDRGIKTVIDLRLKKKCTFLTFRNRP